MGIEPTTFGLKDPPSLVLSFEINSLELGSLTYSGIRYNLGTSEGSCVRLRTSPMAKVGVFDFAIISPRFSAKTSRSP